MKLNYKNNINEFKKSEIGELFEIDYQDYDDLKNCISNLIEKKTLNCFNDLSDLFEQGLINILTDVQFYQLISFFYDYLQDKANKLNVSVLRCIEYCIKAYGSLLDQKTKIFFYQFAASNLNTQSTLQILNISFHILYYLIQSGFHNDEVIKECALNVLIQFNPKNLIRDDFPFSSYISCIYIFFKNDTNLVESFPRIYPILESIFSNCAWGTQYDCIDAFYSAINKDSNIANFLILQKQLIQDLRKKFHISTFENVALYTEIIKFYTALVRKVTDQNLFKDQNTIDLSLIGDILKLLPTKYIQLEINIIKLLESIISVSEYCYNYIQQFNIFEVITDIEQMNFDQKYELVFYINALSHYELTTFFTNINTKTIDLLLEACESMDVNLVTAALNIIIFLLRNDICQIDFQDINTPSQLENPDVQNLVRIVESIITKKNYNV